MNNKDIFERAIGRPAMFAFVLFGGIYLATGQLWSIRMDSTRFLLKKMKLNTQFTINQEEKLMTPEAERFNGWAAMLGFVAAIGAYAVSYTHLTLPTNREV